MRRRLYVINLSLNAIFGALNLVLLAAAMASGGVIWPSMLVAAVNAATAYGVVADEDSRRGHQAILDAQRRSHEAVAALHEDMLAKVKAAREMNFAIGVDGDVDAERRH